MASIAIPQSVAVLAFREELARAGMSRVFLWFVRQDHHQRPVRVHLEDMGAWVLLPAPASDAEIRRAAAQLAMPALAQALAGAHFFDTHDELDVVIDTFDPRVTEAGQLPWQPASTRPIWSNRGARSAADASGTSSSHSRRRSIRFRCRR